MMQKYRFACHILLSCTGKFTDAALLNEQMYILHKHDDDNEMFEIHNEHENEQENAEMLRNKMLLLLMMMFYLHGCKMYTMLMMLR